MPSPSARSVAVSLIASALLGGAARGEDSTPATPSPGTRGEPDATVALSGGAVAAGIGYFWGHGDVVYQGERHRVRVSGLSLVDVGAAGVTTTGVVYNLRNLQDLDGTYIAASAGLTLAGGGSADYLKNEHGVVIKLLSTSRGLRFNLAADGVRVKLQS